MQGKKLQLPQRTLSSGLLRLCGGHP